MKKILCALTAMLMMTFGAHADTIADFSAENLETPEDICTAAMEVYSWFAMSPLAVDETQSDSTGLRCKVLDERLDTKEELSAVVEEYFCPDIAEMLMGSGVYAEENGFLHTSPEGARSIDPSIVSTEYYLFDETETSRTYHAAVFYADETGEIGSLEEYTMLMEKIDGKWVFTSFWFFW